MTTKQYLKTQRMYDRVIPMFLIACIAAALGCTLYIRAHSTNNIDAFNFVLSGMIPAILVIVVEMKLLYWRSRTVRKRHPEMEYLYEWMSLFGLAENYPINGQVKATTAYAASIKLKNAALMADVAFALRDAAIAVAATYKDKAVDHVGRLHVQAVVGQLEREANNLYSEYSRLWDLLIVKLKMKTLTDYNTPREYREALTGK